MASRSTDSKENSVFFLLNLFRLIFTKSVSFGTPKNELKVLRAFREIRLTTKVGIPLVIAQLLQNSMGFVDSAMSGNKSALDLAAVSVGSSNFFLVLVFGMGLMFALAPLVSQSFGAGESKDEIGQHIVQGIWVGLAYSIVAFLVARNMRPAMVAMGIDAAIIPLALEYLDAISWGLPAYFMVFALRGLYEGLTETKVSMYITLLGLIVNIIGNYVLIFGKFGFPALGAVGAGWCSTLSQWSMCLGIIGYTFFNKRFWSYNIFQQIGLVSLNKIKLLLQIGCPIALGLVFEASIFAIFSLLVGRFGVVILAANQIMLNYGSLMFMIPLGLGMATTGRVGIATGANNMKKVRLIGFTSMMMGAAIMTLSSIIIYLLPEMIVGMYTSDPEVTKAALGLLILCCFFQIFDGIQVVGLGALRGLKDTTFPMIVNFIAFWVIGMNLGYQLAFNFGHGAAGLWYGIIVGLTIAAIMHAMRFQYTTKKQLRTQIKRPEFKLATA